jgi:hypothetical protein
MAPNSYPQYSKLRRPNAKIHKIPGGGVCGVVLMQMLGIIIHFVPNDSTSSLNLRFEA